MLAEQWEVLDKKVLGAIWLSLASPMAFNIAKEIMEDLMKALHTLCEKTSTSKMGLLVII